MAGNACPTFNPGYGGQDAYPTLEFDDALGVRSEWHLFTHGKKGNAHLYEFVAAEQAA